MSRPRGTETRKPDAIETPSKKVWMERPDQRREPTAGFIITSSCTLLAEVEVGGDGVLEEVHEEVAGQDQDGRVGARAPSTPAACAGTWPRA